MWLLCMLTMCIIEPKWFTVDLAPSGVIVRSGLSLFPQFNFFCLTLSIGCPSLVYIMACRTLCMKTRPGYIVVL